MEILVQPRGHTHTHTHLNCVKFITITTERQWSTIEPELQTPTHRRGCLTLNVEYGPLLLSTPLPRPSIVIYVPCWFWPAYRNVLASAVILLRPGLTHACHVMAVLMRACLCVCTYII